MKEGISRLARGIVDTEVPRLALLQPNIEEVIAFGRIHQGDLRVNSENRLAFRGLVYSTDRRVTLKSGYFTGESALISYEVDARHLEEGESIIGAFLLVSNGGEYSIPYRFTVQVAAASRYGRLKTVEQFAEMVQEEPDTALRLFDSDEFVRLPFLQDLPARAMYDGLCRGGGKRNAMEEFLVAMGAKEGVRLSADLAQRCYSGTGEVLTDRLTITRNTWGYSAYRISSDADFLVAEKEGLTDADFVGNTCELSFRILPRFLHVGTNYGKLTIAGIYGKLELPVVVEVAGDETNREQKNQFRHHMATYIKADLDRRAGHYEESLLLSRMQSAWDAMAERKAPDVQRKLWQIELAMLRGRKELAGRLLNELQTEVQRRRLEDIDSYCYFLYLQMCLVGSWELKERLIKLLDKYQERGQGTPVVAMLQMQLDESLRNKPAESVDRMREFYRKGLRSPYLYLEACRIYNEIPDVLRKLDTFALQSLWFGAKHEYLNAKAAAYVAKLSASETGFRPELYRILKALYETDPTEELLHAICSILIKGNQRKKEYFSWFAKGVGADVRLTRLYDYYLYTLPDDFEGPLPQVVLLYYSYNSPADAASKLRLYRNVLENFEPGSAMMEAYAQQIQQFTLEQLLLGSVDDSLAVLYRRQLFPEMVDEKMARILPDVLKTCRIGIDNPNLRHVVVVYGELKEEKMVPVRDGVAYVPVYSEDCRLLFSDAYSSRYAGVPFSCTPLFPGGEELLSQCFLIYPNHPMLKLSRCNELLRTAENDTDAAVLLKEELEVAGIHPLYQKKLTAGLIRYYSQMETESGDELLACVQKPYVSRDDRTHLIEALIEREYLAEAFGLIRTYGYEQIQVPLLLKLCSRTIQNTSYQKEDFLLELSYYLFQRGQANDTLLSYLCLHYNGLSREMLALLRRGISQRAETGDLAERLLAQELFTGEYVQLDDVFQFYLKKGPTDKLLVNAYFVVKCYGYFMREDKISEEVFIPIRDIVKSELLAGGVPVICLLALTKYFSSQPDLSDEDRTLGQEMVTRLYHRGLVFPYFKKLGKLFPLPDELMDKTILEFRGNPEATVELFYRIYPGGEGKPMVRAEMPHCYQGIFVKSVLLFSGDVLEYEIWVNEDGVRELVEQGERKADSSGGGTNRFQVLNRLIEGCADPTDEDWQRAVLDYAEKDTLIDAIFTMKAPDGGR
ncbi:DUF5717 family protein [Hominifimenecus sp. rT4P-3]|uniref:DUF5717 family protein n=1 Tax=Hominifimenecus sp. rT4P-3 TaxID=3242979 RepID=UPI003DA6BBCD